MAQEWLKDGTHIFLNIKINKSRDAKIWKTVICLYIEAETTTEKLLNIWHSIIYI